MASLASTTTAAKASSPRTLRVAIIGAGYWGKNYVRILRELSLYPMSVDLPNGTAVPVQLECAAVCDLSQALLDKMLKPIVDTNAQREWNWRPEYGLEEMVDDFLLELRENPQRYA